MIDVAGEFTCEGSPEDLWRYFTDPEILADAAPGCERMELVTPSRLTATLSVGVGSVKPTFDVEALVVECDRPNSLELRASGAASRNSFEASARQELVDNGDGTTTVRWTATAEVSGIIASMGERALTSVGKKLVGDFFQALEDHVTAGTPAESRLEAASPEEVEAAGYGPDVSAEAGELSAGGTDTLLGGGQGGPLPAADWRMLALVTGAVGIAGALVWRRMRSGDGPERGRPGASFVAGLLVGAAGKALWDRRRGADSSEAITTDEHTGGADTNEPPDDISETRENTVEPPADAGSGSGGYFDGNPMDRLRSRDSG